MIIQKKVTIATQATDNTMNTSEIEKLDRILRDIRLEALTATRNLETEDPIVSAFTYISDMATSAISHVNNIEQKQ